MKYTLRQLEIFLAVAESNNVSRAAQTLSLSQPAVSGALAELEQQFDIQLFDRVGKRLKLNEAGASLRAEAQGVMDRAIELEDHFRENDEVGRLNVGATLTIGNYLAVPLLAGFSSLHPGSQLDLDVENTSAIAAKVRNFELDIGLVEGEVTDRELLLEPWRADELTVFCSPENPLAKSGQLTDSDAKNAQWILREPGSGTRQTFDRAFRNFTPKVRLELQHPEAIKRAVRLDLGLGCLSRLTLEDEFNAGSLQPLSTPGHDLQRQFYFLLHRRKFLSAGLKRWMAHCRES